MSDQNDQKIDGAATPNLPGEGDPTGPDRSAAADGVEAEDKPKAKLLLVDDEDRFRQNLAKRLGMRGYDVTDVDNGEAAIRALRAKRPDVVVLDRKMPGMQGEAVLKEIKKISPEVQVIILTGHGSMESAAASGRLDAFAYLEKPCDTDELIRTIEAAGQEKVYAMARHEIPRVEERSWWAWLKGTHNSRPGLMMLGAALFAMMCLLPVPDGLMRLLASPKTGQLGDPIAGFSSYTKLKVGQTVSEYYSAAADRYHKVTEADGKLTKQPLSPAETGRAAMIMIGVLIIAALFWASGALPIGITALLVGVLMYVFGIFDADGVAKAYSKDAVIFIMGVLAFAVGIGKTGLDKRIGLLLLGTSKSISGFLFIFCPLFAVTASFLSEHALVAFIAPVLMIVYMSGVRAAGLGNDRQLAVLLMLSISFVANAGGPGSPAAGGRNAVMIGILADYNMAPSFGEWVMYGLPLVPVMALTIAAYFFFALRRKVKVKDLNVAAIVRRESRKLGKMTVQEYLTAGILVAVVTLWITASDGLGMGGPVLIGLVAMAVLRIITWKDINKISWDVVALYAAACAMGKGLASTGGAMWIADSFVSILPDSLSQGEGLCVASSLFTGVLTNFMSDGATVSAIGPITVPMAQISGTHPWMVGFATAFASSFAYMFVIGTPNNAIAFSLAKDLETGEQLVTLGDFLKHGFIVLLLSFAVLWGWAFFGYWSWIGF